MKNGCRRNLNYIFISIFLLLFSPESAKTQELSLWNDLGLCGGQINALAVNPDNPLVMYAGNWGGDGLFKTNDGGATLFTIPQDMPSWFRNQEIYDIEIDSLWVLSPEPLARDLKQLRCEMKRLAFDRLAPPVRQ